MIQTLKVRGFRSLRDVSWAPGRLNVIIGPNGSGKSNLLRALLLLRISALGKLPEEILRQGGIAPLLWDRQAKELEWVVETQVQNVETPSELDNWRYQLKLRQLGSSSNYRVEHELLDDVSDFSKKAFQRTISHADMFLEPFNYARSRVWSTLGYHRIDLENRVQESQTFLSFFDALDNPIIVGYKDRIVSWSIYHDLRVDQDAPIRQAQVARVEDRVDEDGQNLIPVLHTLYSTHRDFKRDIDMAMGAAFGNDFEELLFPPAADQRVQLRLRWRSLQSTQSAADLSDGTIRFLLLIAILANPEPFELIAIDEPETGLHPSMLPIVAEYARQAADRGQVILTTHSPQLLDAFGNEPPTTTVSRTVDGETQLSVIDGDELKRWLEEFSMGALFRSGELEDMV
jgi:predicted ATPase